MLFAGPIPGLVEQNDLTANGDFDPTRPQTVLRLATGQTLVLPTELLLSATGEAVSLRRDVAAPTAAPTPTPVPTPSPSSAPPATHEQIIPLLEEHADVGKRLVETAKVRLHRGTERFNQTVTLPLTSIGWEVERTPIGQLVADRPDIRQEGDTTVYPLVEERFVARREYFIVEEVRVRRVATTTEQTATLELQRDTLSVERQPLPDNAR